MHLKPPFFRFFRILICIFDFVLLHSTFLHITRLRWRTDKTSKNNNICTSLISVCYHWQFNIDWTKTDIVECLLGSSTYYKSVRTHTHGDWDIVHLNPIRLENCALNHIYRYLYHYKKKSIRFIWRWRRQTVIVLGKKTFNGRMKWKLLCIDIVIETLLILFFLTSAKGYNQTD